MDGASGRADVTVPGPYLLATFSTLVLAGLASAVGVFVPGIYRDAAVLVPQARGQDLLTLAVALPALAVSLYYARAGSLRAYVGWLGLTGYVLYTYASYAFMTAFNELYLVYVALLSLTLFSLVGGAVRLDVDALGGRLDGHPVRAYVAFQTLVAGLVALLWLSEIVPAVARGGVPASAADAGIPVNVIHSLDLGVVLPGLLLSAYWLRERRPWGYAFTGILLVKVATLGLAVLAMIVLLAADGRAVPLPQVVIFASIAAFGLLLVGRYLGAIGG